jgi:hypothetical protein
MTGNWEAYDITPCLRCGVPGGYSHLSHDQACNLCQLEIEEGIVWPWLMTEVALDAIVTALSAQGA